MSDQANEEAAGPSDRAQHAQILDVHVALLRMTGAEADGTLETRLLLADACEAGAAALRVLEDMSYWRPTYSGPVSDGTCPICADTSLCQEPTIDEDDAPYCRRCGLWEGARHRPPATGKGQY